MTEPQQPIDPQQNPYAMPSQGMPPQGMPPQGQQVVYVQAPKKKGGCMKWGAIITAALVVIVGLGMAMGGGDDATSSSSNSSADQNGGNADKKKPPTDAPVAIGEVFKTKKAEVTASNLRDVGADFIGDNHVCADVLIKNVTTDKKITMNGLTDWELTDPSGVTSQMSFTPSTDYDPVEVGPGGQKAGTVCFKSNAAPGNYTIAYTEGLSLSTEKAKWTATL